MGFGRRIPKKLSEGSFLETALLPVLFVNKSASIKISAPPKVWIKPPSKLNSPEAERSTTPVFSPLKPVTILLLRPVRVMSAAEITTEPPFPSTVTLLRLKSPPAVMRMEPLPDSPLVPEWRTSPFKTIFPPAWKSNTVCPAAKSCCRFCTVTPPLTMISLSASKVSVPKFPMLLVGT